MYEKHSPCILKEWELCILHPNMSIATFGIASYHSMYTVQRPSDLLQCVTYNLDTMYATK